MLDSGDDPTAAGAMTEVALALVMALFCILVVALVSTGRPSVEPATVAFRSSGPNAAPASLRPDDVVVLLHRGELRLLRDGMPGEPVSADAIPGPGRIVLAVDPRGRLDRIIAVHDRLPPGRAVVLTPLSAEWRRRLSGRQ